MLKLTIAVTGLIAAALAASACGSAQPHPAAHQRPSSSASAPATTPPAPLLTRAQSRARYLRIIQPGNVAVGATTTDLSDDQPWPVTRRDLQAAVGSEITASQQISAVRWAPAVQPFMAAEVATYTPSVIHCFRAQAQSGSDAAATAVSNENGDCQLAQASTIPDQIRTLLNLPGRE